MKKFAILTTTYPDQPGIFATNTDLVSSCGANIIRDIGYAMGGMGFVHILFSTDGPGLLRIKQAATEQLARFCPQIIEVDEAAVAQECSWPQVACYDIDVVAKDEPGIAAELETPTAHLGINVIEVRGCVCGKGDAAMFIGSYRVEIPNTPTVRQMQRMIDEMAARRGWSIHMRPALTPMPPRTFPVVSTPSPVMPEPTKPTPVLPVAPAAPTDVPVEAPSTTKGSPWAFGIPSSTKARHPRQRPSTPPQSPRMRWHE